MVSTDLEIGTCEHCDYREEAKCPEWLKDGLSVRFSEPGEDRYFGSDGAYYLSACHKYSKKGKSWRSEETYSREDGK